MLTLLTILTLIIIITLNTDKIISQKVRARFPRKSIIKYVGQCRGLENLSIFIYLLLIFFSFKANETCQESWKSLNLRGNISGFTGPNEVASHKEVNILLCVR